MSKISEADIDVTPETKRPGGTPGPGMRDAQGGRSGPGNGVLFSGDRLHGLAGFDAEVPSSSPGEEFRQRLRFAISIAGLGHRLLVVGEAQRLG